MPAGRQPDGTPPPEVGAPQEPVGLPAPLMQLPLQQSALLVQISFGCVQNDTAPEQIPLLHRPEQQSVALPHGLPAVRHVWPGFALAHRFPWQMPLQQSPPWPHAPAVGLSGTQILSEHAPFTHEPVQHSVPDWQLVPGALQVGSSGAAHLFVDVEQFAVQHWALLVQSCPVARHAPASFSDASLSVSGGSASPPPSRSPGGWFVALSGEASVPVASGMTSVSLPQAIAVATAAPAANRRKSARPRADEAVLIRSSSKCRARAGATSSVWDTVHGAARDSTTTREMSACCTRHVTNGRRGRRAVHVQLPPLQIRPPGQPRPHAPQLFRSAVVSTQRCPQRT